MFSTAAPVVIITWPKCETAPQDTEQESRVMSRWYHFSLSTRAAAALVDIDHESATGRRKVKDVARDQNRVYGHLPSSRARLVFWAAPFEQLEIKCLAQGQLCDCNEARERPPLIPITCSCPGPSPPLIPVEMDTNHLSWLDQTFTFNVTWRHERVRCDEKMQNKWN